LILNIKMKAKKELDRKTSTIFNQFKDGALQQTFSFSQDTLFKDEDRKAVDESFS